MRGRTWLWAGLIILSGASCVAILDGEHPYKQGDTTITGAPCTTTANCDDKNPCTTDSCPTSTLVCEYVLQAEGLAPDSAQVGADCKRIKCMDGEPVTEDDPQDVVNDGNPCTVDSCAAGMAMNQVLPDGSACKQGDKMGTCAAGMCKISCSTTNDCNDNNPCSEDFCNTSMSLCVYTNLDGVPTPGVMQTPGDCKIQLCENGIDKSLNDDADIVNDNNPCTTDVCVGGKPSSNPVPERTLCVPGETNVCSSVGVCVECVVAGDCVKIVETECEKRSCVNNKCQIAYQGTDTLASPVLQKANDCRKVVCNGNMGTTSVNDDTDLPNDGNPCTKDVCTNGTPANAPEAQNLNCGGMQVCDGTGNCVGCTADAQCPGTDDFCKRRVCMNNVCGMSYTPNNTDLPSGQTVGDCKVLQCDGAGNVKTSVSTTDVPVDNNPCTNDVCNVMGVPSNPATPINSMCNVNGNDVCDGSGNCKKSLGKTCAAGADCVSTNCVDGVCCNNTCTTTCQSCNVPGSLGTCSDVPAGQDDGMCTGATISCNIGHDCDSVNGQPCSAGNSCLSNFCADGVCCESACDVACKTCNNAGMAGICGNVPATMPDNFPVSICSGSNQCDGNGVCKKSQGGPCANSNECVTGFCTDGVCCDSACTATCKSCNTPGSVGTCANVAMGVDDGMCVGSTRSCDGMGGCKSENGAPCVANNECFSTSCVDAVCCNTPCNGLCRSCNVPGSVGACSNTPAGQDPDNECADQGPASCGNNGQCDGAASCQKYASGTVCSGSSCSGSTQTNEDTCDGFGTCVDNGTMSCNPYLCGPVACKTTCGVDAECTTGYFCNTMGSTCMPKKGPGQPCTAPNQCNSGFCADGVCCLSACTGTCQYCNMGGGCATMGFGQQDTFPAGTCEGTRACDGSGNGTGACKLLNGQPCMSPTTCLSGKCSGVCIP